MLLVCYRRAAAYPFPEATETQFLQPVRGTTMKMYNARLKVRLFLLVSVMTAGILGLTAHSIVRDRALALQEAEVDANVSLRAMSQLWDIIFASVGSRLEGSARLMTTHYQSLDALRDPKEFLRASEALNSPSVTAAVLFDADGQVIAQRGEDTSREDVHATARALLDRQAVTPLSPTVAIAFPRRAEQSGEWVVPVSRTIVDKQGKLKGLLVAHVSTTLLRGMYEQLTGVINRPLTVSLVGADGTRLEWAEDINGFTRDWDTFPLSRLAGETGAFDHQALVNRVDEHFVYRSLTPVGYALVGYSVQDALAPWKRNSLWRAALALLCSLLVMALGFASYKASRRLQQERDHVESRNNQLAAKVADVKVHLKETTDELDALVDVVPKNLRNPAQQARGYLAMALGDLAPERSDSLKSLLRRVDLSVGQMEKAIAQVHELSQVNRELLTVELCDVSTMVHQAADQQRREEPGRKVDVRVQAGMMVDANRRQLQVLLDNLVSNAWKFTHDVAEPSISVGMLLVDGVPSFFVEDNGMGFDPAKKDSLFLPFQRLHVRSDLDGAGLGLATVHRVAKRHGGRSWATPNTGPGATFWFTVSARAPAARSAAPLRWPRPMQRMGSFAGL
jgi:signal transduction histidine kinase